MTPGEALAHIEENQPRQIGGMSVEDIERIDKRRSELEAQGVTVW